MTAFHAVRPTANADVENTVRIVRISAFLAPVIVAVFLALGVFELGSASMWFLVAFAVISFGTIYFYLPTALREAAARRSGPRLSLLPNGMTIDGLLLPTDAVRGVLRARLHQLDVAGDPDLVVGDAFYVHHRPSAPPSMRRGLQILVPADFTEPEAMAQAFTAHLAELGIPFTDCGTDGGAFHSEKRRLAAAQD